MKTDNQWRNCPRKHNLEKPFTVYNFRGNTVFNKLFSDMATIESSVTLLNLVTAIIIATIVMADFPSQMLRLYRADWTQRSFNPDSSRVKFISETEYSEA